MPDLNVIRQLFFCLFYSESENVLVQEQFHVSQVAGVLALRMEHRGGNISQNFRVGCAFLNYSTFRLYRLL